MIRPMQREDVPQIAALERLCFADPWSEASVAAELENDLSQPSAAEILRSMGYPENGQLSSLVRKFRAEEEFPHEIGLFLGYPPEDVQGFLDNRPCKCVGCWKVYGDVDSARKKFSLYKKCARVYCDRLAKGTDMNRLIVAG